MIVFGRRAKINKLMQDPTRREIRQLREDNRLLEKEIRMMHLEV